MRRIRRHRLGWRLGRLLRGRTVDRVIAAGLPFLLAVPIASCKPHPDAGMSPSPPSEARLSLLAVGDTGRTRPLATLFEGSLSVSEAMTEEALRDPVDGVVLLGDNFYWNGLSSGTLVPRVAANLVRPFCHFLRLDGPRSDEVSSACRRPETTRSPVPIYAVLGNHDIEIEESPRLQREVIPEFLPDWQMSPGLARAIELGHGVSLILFESEPEIDDPEAIRRALVDAIQSARGPWRILATHRPVATDDLARPFVGGYPEFVLSSIEAAGRPVQLVLAAHHHNLQVFELTGATPLLHVGVGSGARAEPPIAEDHPDARFGRLALGFVRVDLIGGDSDARLSATLFEAPRWPVLAPLRPAGPIARFEVDLAGRVRRPGEVAQITQTDRP
jgi:predicted MPP superfamily phosphohydrolase